MFMSNDASSTLLVDTLDFIKKSFGRVIRAKRVKAGMSQRDLASRANVRPETVCRIEAGQGNPTVGTLKKIAMVLE